MDDAIFSRDLFRSLKAIHIIANLTHMSHLCIELQLR